MTIKRSIQPITTRTIALLAYEDCQGSAISSLIEAFDIANLYAARGDAEATPLFRWVVVSPDGAPAHAMGGVRIRVDGAPADVPAPDLIFIPGLHFGGSLPRFVAQIEALAERCGPWLRAQQEAGRMIAASCAGAFVLAEAGLLDGRRATTSWWLGRVFRTRYPKVKYCEGELVVRDDRIVSSGAFTACLDLALQVIEHFGGAGLALSCAKVMLIHAKQDSQFTYMTLQARIQHPDELVLKAQSHIRSNLRLDLSVEGLSKALCVSPRTLNRRFHDALGCSPMQYIQEVRVEGAKRLLETTDLTFDEIVRRVGHDDPSSFRRVFERTTRVSPMKYRRMFSLSARTPPAAVPGSAGKADRERSAAGRSSAADPALLER